MGSLLLGEARGMAGGCNVVGAAATPLLALI
jgi:hypothetical protein